MLFISHFVPTSPPDDPRYAKGWLDILFIAYHIIVFSFIRQFTLFEIIFPIARKLGIKKQAKLDRFGEQAYAVLYYGTMGFWGAVSYFYISSNSTKALIVPLASISCHLSLLGGTARSITGLVRSLAQSYIHLFSYLMFSDYPHWDMKPLLKRYYLMHFSYWIQQLIVLILRIEKPRKDFKELAAHHVVTLWLIGYVRACLGGQRVNRSMLNFSSADGATALTSL